MGRRTKEQFIELTKRKKLGAPRFSTGAKAKAATDTREPDMTAELARDVVKFLEAGVPMLHMLFAIAPDHYLRLKRGKRMEWGKRWSTHPHVVEALKYANGDEWQNLGADRRLEIGYNKHLAQLAYFLYSHDYPSLYGPDLDKAHEARKALKDYLQGGENANSPWMQFLDDVRQGKVAIGSMPVETMPDTPSAIPTDTVKKRGHES